MPNLMRAANLMSYSSSPVYKPRVLAVDDDQSQLYLLTELLQNLGYDVHPVANGEQALWTLRAHADAIDAVILDQEMPGMSGLEVVERIKADITLAAIPVIMHTGHNTEEYIRSGIDAGVFYYLVKSNDTELLQSVTAAAVRERHQRRMLHEQLKRFDTAFRMIGTMQLTVRTITDAENAACLLASCFPEPERAVSGLMDLLLNAVEHGNLGITYDEKTRLLHDGKWQAEIARRQSLPEYAQRKVDVIYQCRAEGWVVQITDEGEGFDWRRHWQIDPAHASASHGRGIARARLLSFDRVAYNESGNQVKAMVDASSPNSLAW